MLKDAFHTTTEMVGVVRDQLERVGDFRENLCDEIVYPVHLRKERSTTLNEMNVWIWVSRDDEFFDVF